MHEYHKRWSAFVAFAVKQEEVLRPISETMNHLYDKLYSGFPTMPSFSIFRMLVRIWKRTVFSSISGDLTREVIGIITQF